MSKENHNNSPKDKGSTQQTSIFKKSSVTPPPPLRTESRSYPQPKPQAPPPSQSGGPKSTDSSKTGKK